MLWIARKINANMVLEYLGKGSLVVYMSHFAYLRLLAKVLPNIISPYETISGFTFYIITFILATALSGATIWLFNHKYLKILIGKF